MGKVGTLIVTADGKLTRKKTLTFERKMSGTRVDGCKAEPLFKSGFVTLDDVMKLDLSQETMNYILDNFRFYRGERTEENAGECIWWTSVDRDTNIMLAILEKPEYAEYKCELIGYFGENWMKHYIRFNH